MSTPLIQDREPPSSVERKLPLEVRRKLDHALRTMDGATYQELFDQFQLAAGGISFSAFYRYARRRRAVARIADLAGKTPPTVDIATHSTTNQTLDSADGATKTSRMHPHASPEAARRLAHGAKRSGLATDHQPRPKTPVSPEDIASPPSESDDIRLEFAAARYVCKYMIGLIQSGKASARQIERLANAYSKTASVQITRDRINANIEYQRERIEIAHKSLQMRAEAVSSRANNATPANAKSNQHPDAPTADAPWGRKADGTPTTREEFLTRLDQACADIYGLDLKYGPKPIIKRFPGDHLPPELRTPENIAAGQRGLLPHEIEGERKAKEDRIRRAEFDAKRDAEEAAKNAEEAARHADEARRRREEFENAMKSSPASTGADGSIPSPGAENSPASPGASGPAALSNADRSPTSTTADKHHPNGGAACHGNGTSPVVGSAHPTASVGASQSPDEAPKHPGTEAQRQAKLRADRRAEWEEKHRKEFPPPQKCERPDTLDDLLKPKSRGCDLPNFCVDWTHK